MPTKKCPFCQEEIMEDAIKCKHCGSMLNQKTKKEGNLWLPVISLTLSCLFAVGVFKEAYNHQAVFGFAVLSIIPFILAFISFTIQKKGKEMAITALAVSAFSILLSFSF